MRQSTLQVKTNKHWDGRYKKIVSGLLVAALLVATPLPAFADTTPSTGASITTQPPAQSTPSTADATPTPAPASAPTPTPTTPTPVLSLSNPADIQTPVTLSSDKPTAVQPANTPAPAGNTTTISGQNNISSTTVSGDASVNNNKKAGDATSGSATANATVVNVANSSTNFGTGTNFTYFSHDIYNQDADYTIDPAKLMQGGGAGNTSTGDFQTAVSLTDILNNINLSAKSGNASVSDNGKAGDATTGDASALANIINIVGSTISAQNSFLGVVNIYGNMKGNILVPQSFVDSLINGTATGVNGPAISDTNISNNINASALSGDATVSGNKKAGDATSGNATTNLEVYNLTGQQVVAKNSLLVFVNVLGKWVGMIVQAPGSNNALLGKDATTATDGSGLVTTGNSTTNITNNISVDATSGDATVSGNKKAGDATSGNAAAGVNLVNITNSDFKLGDWFGALFINVLGSWIGDFGIKADTPPTTTTTTDPTTVEPAIQDVKIFRFDSEAPVTPAQDDTTNGQSQSKYNSNSIALTASITDDKPTGTVLGASTTKGSGPQDPGTASHSISIDMVALVAVVGALTLLIALGSLALRRRFVVHA